VRSLDGSVVSVLTNPRSGDRLDTVYRALCIQEENTVRVGQLLGLEMCCLS
jgi:hypothetical protein